jgi:hypothetical protein
MPVGWAVTVVLLCVAVVALAIIVLGLLRQVTPLLERAAGAHDDAHALANQGPAVGSQVPHFAVSGPDGEFTPEQLRGQPAVLLFLTEGCGPCTELAQEIGQADPVELPSQLVVVTGPDGVRELGLPRGLRVVTEPDKEVSDPLSVIGTPLAISLDSAGIVKAVRVTNTLEQLDALTAGVS